MYFQNFPAELFKNINPELVETINRSSLSIKLLNLRKNLKEAVFEICYQFYPEFIKNSLNDFYLENPLKRQKFFFNSLSGAPIRSQEEYEFDVKCHVFEYLPFLFGSQKELSCRLMSTNRYKELQVFLVFLEQKLSSKLAEDRNMLAHFSNELPNFFIKKMNVLSINAISDSVKLRSLDYFEEQCGYSSLQELIAELHEWNSVDKSIKAIQSRFIDKMDSLYFSSFLNWSPSLFFMYVGEKNIVEALLKRNLIKSEFFNFMCKRFGKMCGALDVLVESGQFAVIEALVVNGVLNPSHFNETHFTVIARQKNNEMLCLLFERNCIRSEWIEREMYDSIEMRGLMSLKETAERSVYSMSTNTSSQNLSGLATPAAPIVSPSPVGAEALYQEPNEDVEIKKQSYQCGAKCSML